MKGERKTKGMTENINTKKKEPKYRLMNQSIEKFLTRKPRVTEHTSNPGGNVHLEGKYIPEYGGETVINGTNTPSYGEESINKGENKKPEMNISISEPALNIKTGNGKGRLSVELLLQRQHRVVQNTDSCTELTSDRYTDSLGRSRQVCTEKQPLAGLARQTETYQE